MDIIAITVSTEYEDYLSLALQENCKFFKKWYIITEKSDIATQQLCSKYNNVEVLYFKFSKGDRVSFNKGGALRKAQQQAYTEYPNDLYLVIDSDVCISKDLINYIQTMKIQEDCVYGADRLMIPTINNYLKSDCSTFKCDSWQHTKNLSKPNWWNVPWGYFQLYKTKHLYKNSQDAGKADIHFSHCFLYKYNLPFAISHIGPCSQNWNGRKTAKETPI